MSCGLSVIAAPLASQFVARVDLVEVYATVTDRSGEPVTTLAAGDFQLLEDGAAQEVRTFAHGEMPLALAVGIDRSFSIRAVDLKAVAAAVSRVLSALRPADESMVIAIGSDTEVIAPRSTDRTQALRALAALEPWGTTPLFDATLSAVQDIQALSGRRAIILISDGEDRYSRTSATALVGAVRGADVLVYPVTVGKRRAPTFTELAAVSGGRSFQAADTRALPEILATIIGELRVQYLLGYVPTRDPDAEPRWRSITVSVNRPDLVMRAREGYVGR